MKYKSIFISDLHLGTKHAKAEVLLDFIKHNEAEELYLVGDIIDGWAMRQKVRWKQTHSDVIQKILRAARKGTVVNYITGNHDEFLRAFLPLLLGDNLNILNDTEYIDAQGKKYFVTHGDMFDTMTMTKKWLTI
ncbi:MAG: UDP-2,3-diacylglucosamine diphosphatase, partial [Sulfurovum sp.]|nr:UDP-2,3-diacylglucosamine diphosphatase [Sulfurovum sp.]